MCLAPPAGLFLPFGQTINHGPDNDHDEAGAHEREEKRGPRKESVFGRFLSFRLGQQEHGL